MTSRLTRSVEPFFSNPMRRDTIRRILTGGLKKEKKMVSSFIDPSFKSILDFGCGTGEFSEIFPPKAYHGVDVDSMGIEQARRMHPRYRFSSINSISDVGGKYELIVLIDMVHHLSPDIFRAALTDFKKRLLSTDGTLLIMDPLHPREQKLSLGRWLFAHDRGNFPRTKEQITSDVSSVFKIVSYELFQENLLTFYLLAARHIKRG